MVAPRVENPRLKDSEVSVYHVWFSPKKRKATLDGDIGQAAREELVQIAKAKAIKLLACELGYDHVHMLIELGESQTLLAVMHQLKGASAHRLFQRFTNLKMDLGHISFWQRGYGSRRLQPYEVPIVQTYILKHRELSEPRVFNPRSSLKLS